MKAHKSPIRTCIGCGETSEKRNVVRFVRTTEGHVELDPSGKLKGRGAYMCEQLDCFELAYKRRRLASSLRVALSEDDYDRLRRDFVALLTARDAEGKESDCDGRN